MLFFFYRRPAELWEYKNKTKQKQKIQGIREAMNSAYLEILKLTNYVIWITNKNVYFKWKEYFFPCIFPKESKSLF